VKTVLSLNCIDYVHFAVGIVFTYSWAELMKKD